MSVTAAKVFRASWLASCVFIQLAKAQTISDGSFEQGSGSSFSSSWETSGQASRVTNTPMSGTYSAQVNGSTNAATGINTSRLVQAFAVSTGRTFEVTGYVRHNTGSQLTASNSAYLRLEYVDSSGTVLTNANSTRIFRTSSTNRYFYLNSGTLTAPANTVTGRAVLVMEQVSNATGHVFFDQINLRLAESIMEPFSGYTVSASLNNLNGGTGWTNAWTESNSGAFTINSGSLPAASGYPSTSGDKTLVSPPAAGSRTAYRSFPTVGTGRVYAAYVMNYQFGETAGGGDGKYVGLSLMSNATELAFIGEVGNAAATFGVAAGGVTMGSAYGLSAGSGNDYTLVCVYDFDTSILRGKAYHSSQTVSSTEPSATDWDASVTATVYSINGIRIAAGASSGTPGDCYFDEIRVASSWQELLTNTYSAPVATNFLVNNVFDGVTNITDAMIASGNYNITFHIRDTNGVNTTSNTYPYMTPSYRILNQDDVAILTNVTFSATNLIDSGRTAILSNASHSAVAGSAIGLGSYKVLWSAANSVGVSRLNYPFHSNQFGNVLNSFSVVDDDPDPPEVTTLKSTNTGGGSFRNLHISLNSSNISSASGSSTNLIYRTTDGALASVAADNPLNFWMGARDDSGLSRNTTDATTNTHFFFGAIVQSNVANFDTTRSSDFASTANTRSTNVWTWTTPFSASEINNLVTNTTDGLGTNKVSLTLFDADTDRVGDQSVVTQQQYGFLAVTDDDTDLPIFSTNLTAGRGPMDFLIGDTSYYESGSYTDAVFRVTDGDLATITNSNPMKFVFNIYDEGSGISRANSGSAGDYLNYDIGTNSFGQDIFATYSNGLSSSSTIISTATSIYWHSVNFTIGGTAGGPAGVGPFTFNETSEVYALIQSATNPILVSAADADSDRGLVTDQAETTNTQAGLLAVVDDDTAGPSVQIVYVGTNYSVGVSETNTVTDGELLNGFLDFGFTVSDPSGVFISNAVAAATDVSSAYGNVNINWDLQNPDGYEFGLDNIAVTNVRSPSGNGSTVVTVDVFNVANIVYSNNVLGSWYLQVSAQDHDMDRGTVTVNVGGSDKVVSFDRSITINSQVVFTVIDDDSGNPTISNLTVSGTGSALSRFGTMVNYDFDNDDGDAFETNANTVAANIMASGFDESGGSLSGTSSGNGNPLFATQEGSWGSSAKYYFFSVVVASDYQLAITNVSFHDRRTATGPSNWMVRYSGDNYTANLASGTNTSSSVYVTNSVALSLSGLTGTNTFRIIGTNAPGSGNWNLDNVTLSGSVQPLAGSGFVSDQDLAQGTMIITGNIYDADSGVYSNKYSPYGTRYDLYSPTAAIVTGTNFNDGPLSNGAARTEASAIVTTNLTISPSSIVLGVHTVQVYATDFDDDRTNDFLSVTQTVSFTVIDDDTNAPIRGSNTKVFFEGSSITASGSGSNRLFGVSDGRLRSLGGSTNLQFAFYVDDNSGLIRGTTDASTQCSMSVSGWVTNNVANYDAASSSPSTYAGEDITNIWTFSTALSYDHVTALYGVTNPIYVNLFDADFDRTDDQLTTLTNQFGLFAVDDDDSTAPLARTNTAAFTIASLAVYDGGFSGTNIWITDTNSPAIPGNRENQQYLISDGRLTNQTDSAPLIFTAWIFDNVSGLNLGTDSASNCNITVGSVITENGTNYAAAYSRTNVNSTLLATLSTQSWAFANISTNTVGAFYDASGHSNRITVEVFDADLDRAGDSTNTSFDLGWFIVYDDDVEGPTMPGTRVYDSFEDGGRTDGGDSYDVAWYSETTEMGFSINDDRTGLGDASALRVVATNGGQMVGSFTSNAVLSSDNDFVSFSFDFRMTNAVNNNAGFRFGLYNSSSTAVTADGDGDSADDVGYAVLLGIGTSNGAAVVEETGTSGGITVGGDLTTLSNAASFNLDESAIHSAEVTFFKLSTGVRIELFVDSTNLVSVEDTTAPFYTNFNEVAFGFGTNVANFIDNITVAKSTVTSGPTAWTNNSSFTIQWSTGDVYDVTGVGTYRITTNSIVPTSITSGLSVGLVTQATVVITNEGLTTNFVFAVDRDADRPLDGAKSPNAPFITKYDITPPARITSLAGSNGLDEASEIALNWTALTNAGNRADGTPLSPWYSYIVYYSTNASGPTTNDNFIVYTNGPSSFATNVTSSATVSNFDYDATYYLAMAGIDYAGNIGTLSPTVQVTTASFVVTQGMVVATSGVWVAWTGSSNSIYDGMYVDSTTYSDSLTNSWATLETVTNTYLTDTGSTARISPSDLVNTLRFYRVSRDDAWQTNNSPRRASREIYVGQTLQLQEGENWYSLCSIPDTNTVAFIFGTNRLPRGATVGASTKISWYGASDGSATNIIYLVSSGNWLYSVGGSGLANNMSVPLGQGFNIELPPGSSDQSLVIVGKLPTNELVQAIQPSGVYNLVSYTVPTRVTVSQLQLVETGFTGGSNPNRSDEIRILSNTSGSGSLQSPEMRIWYDTVDARYEYRASHYGSGDASGYVVDPSDSIIIISSASTNAWSWTNKLYYTTPTKNITP